MATNHNLHGLKVMVTRPAQQAKKLCEQISNVGGQAITFPAIDIKPVPIEHWNEIKIDDQDILIFVSRNAVEYFTRQYALPLSKKLLVVAIGSGTAQYMESVGMHAHAFPDKAAGSETLLTLTLLQQVSNRNILIVRGQGGRELLAETLTKRGAKVCYLEVYHRALPKPSEQCITAALKADCAIVTSIEGLENLSDLLITGLAQLKTKPLLVISDRIRQHALMSGFKRVVLAAGASDEMIVQQLLTMRDDDEQ